MYTGPVTYTFDELVEHKKSGLASSATLAELRKNADEILTQPILRVTDKKLKAISGNNHDYMSMGLYWWPNPDTPDGLPYIRRDGYSNPNANDGSQPVELKRTKGMGYSFYNLDAMLVIASLAEKLGYKNYWEVDPERNCCVIKSAVDYLYPYVINPDSFPYQELHPHTYGSRMAHVMLVLDKRFPGEGYAERAAKLMSGNEEWLLEPLL